MQFRISGKILRIKEKQKRAGQEHVQKILEELDMLPHVLKDTYPHLIMTLMQIKTKGYFLPIRWAKNTEVWWFHIGTDVGNSGHGGRINWNRCVGEPSGSVWRS